MQQEIICRDPDVLNQFKYAGGVGRSACVCICIQAIFHLSEAMKGPNNEFSILNKIQWQHVMTKGARTWQLWHEANPDAGLFPKPSDIFALPQCQGFYRLFKKEVIECGGLAQGGSGSIFSMEDLTSDGSKDTVLCSLENLLASLVNKKSMAYALATMPGNSAVALVCRPASLGNYAIFLFDPHGRAGTDDVTFLQFTDYLVVLEYLLKRYQVGSIDEKPPHRCLLKRRPLCRNCEKGEVCSFYTEVYLADTYQYDGYLFTNL